MENKTKVKFPDAYLSLVEDLRLLHSDGTNPNRMLADFTTKMEGVDFWILQ